MRNAYYLRKEQNKTARNIVDELFKKKNSIIDPMGLITFERGNSELDDINNKRLAEVYNVTEEYLVEDDGKDWRNFKP